MNIEELRALGVNVDEGLERCMNNEGFYLGLVEKALKSDDLEKMKAAFENGEIEVAFSKAHDLKGMLGNLSITQLYVPVSEFCDLLRGKNTVDDDGGYLDIIFSRFEKFKELI